MHTLFSVLCRFENKLSDLLSWIKTWKTSVQALASTHPETTPCTPDLQENLKVNLPEKKQKKKKIYSIFNNLMKITP